MRWQVIRGHVCRVIDCADNHRLIRVTLEKVDDHLMPNARQEERPPLFPGPTLGDAYPAGTLLVALALAVPVELHPYTAILIGVDLLTRRPHYYSGLGPLHDRFGRDARWAKRSGLRYAGKGVGIEGGLAAGDCWWRDG